MQRNTSFFLFCHSFFFRILPHFRDADPGPKTTSAFFRQLQRFCFSSQIFHFLTSKVNHNDRNGHITCNFFHCQAMISSFTKVMGPQSRKIVEKTEVENCYCMLRHKAYDSEIRKCIQHNRSDDISHTTYYF